MQNKEIKLPTIKQMLKRYNIKIHKSLGQNFLLDNNIANKIAKYSEPTKKTIIEIGPGPGSLTRSILQRNPQKLFAIDKDIQSKIMLTDLESVYPNKLRIITGDALDYPIWKLGSVPRQVISNLPYNVSTKMLTLWLKYINNFECLTLMFQKEVADRILAKQGSKHFGRLSILTNWLTKSSKLFDVPNSAFFPSPKVKSTVIQLRPLPKPLYNVSFDALEKITKMAFSQKRKMLKSSLNQLGGKKFLDELDISANLRPEELSIVDFCRIAEKAFES